MSISAQTDVLQQAMASANREQVAPRLQHVKEAQRAIASEDYGACTA